ncbi:hypothetical protein EO92_10560 [Methanosarcina sp. 2.H.A.1B.4]|nr:hypothetical protein EO92_10560 [Methanosarcina sp. 2.H.A.1B.4]
MSKTATFSHKGGLDKQKRRSRGLKKRFPCEKTVHIKKCNLELKSKIKNQESRIKNQESKIKNQKSRIKKNETQVNLHLFEKGSS